MSPAARACAALLALSLFNTPALRAQDAAPAPSPTDPITWTFADALSLYSQLISLQMQGELQRQGKLSGANIAIVLLDVDGLSALTLLLPAADVAKLQKNPPAQQIKSLQNLNKVFWLLFTGLIQADSKALLGDLAEDRSYPSPIAQMVSSFLASRTADQFSLRVGFVQDEKSHLYVTVTGDTVVFNPECPTARQ